MLSDLTRQSARARLDQVRLRLDDDDRYRDAMWKQRLAEQHVRNGEFRARFEDFVRPVFFGEKPNEHFDGLFVWKAPV